MYISGLRGLRDGAGGSANIPTGFCCATGYHPYFLPQGNSGDARFPYWTCQSDTNPKLGGAPVKCPQGGTAAGSAGGGLPTGGTSTGISPYAGGATGTMTATTAKPCPVVPCPKKPCPPCVPQPCEEQPCYETGDSGGQTDNRNMTGLRGMRGLRGCGCGGNCNRCRQASPCEWG